MSKPKLRALPLLTAINIFIIDFAFAILHVLLKPTGLEPAVAAFCVGNLFGIVLPYFGVIAAVARIILKPVLDWIAFPGAYESLILDKARLWVGLWAALNIVVACSDSSHRCVDGADYRPRTGIVAKAAEAFFDTNYEYLKMTVVPWDKSADLPSNRKYIFACHPHGIHCTPLFLFHRKGSPFDKRFPGICENKLSGLAASVMFKIPGVREVFLSLPYIDASRSVAEAALKANRSLFVCTGSGEESLLTTKGEDILVLSRRKGFVRLALAYGCDIVPIFGVGNSDLFKTYSWGMGVRMWLQKKLHISIPIFHGRYLTPLPYRVPVTVIVGEPLKVPTPKVYGEQPDDAVVEEYLKKYIEKVKEVHKKHAHGRKLQII
ncbi:hypothetical protein ACHAWF_002050 [Thalassiosira exigua]